jgi:hypothetical protein
VSPVVVPEGDARLLGDRPRASRAGRHVLTARAALVGALLDVLSSPLDMLPVPEQCNRESTRSRRSPLRHVTVRDGISSKLPPEKLVIPQTASILTRINAGQGAPALERVTGIEPA